jgi:hypothetical protein
MLMRNSLANKYYLDDYPSAATAGSRLNGILVKIASGDQLSSMSQDFLATRGFQALYSLASGSIDWATFQQLAEIESHQRTQASSKKAEATAAKYAEIEARQAAALKEHFAAMARDPKLRRQREAKELRNRFGIGYVEPEHYPHVMSLLRRISCGQRLQPDEVVWLKTEADDCWTDQIAKEWHALEAEALSALWRTGGEPWDAINGSSHWRKAGKPEAALSLTGEALAKKGVVAKIRSALETTRGGALRDMRRLDEAKALGLSAHHLTPNDFRPCTLLGAVHIELGDLVAGHKWYVKAEKLGANKHAVDQDLRALIARAARAEQDRIRSFLIAQDPVRFSWLRTK